MQDRKELLSHTHPSDSPSRYPAVNGLYIHKQLCLSAVLICLSALKRHKQINPTIRINSWNICSLLYRLKAEPSIHKNLSAIQVAKPYQFTKNLHPSDSHSHYPAVNGLYVHKQLCLSAVLVSLSALKRHKQINPTAIINSWNICSLLYRLKAKYIV